MSGSDDTDALAEQVARALYRAAGLDGKEFRESWEKRSRNVHLRYLALARGGVLPILAEREAALRAELDRLTLEIQRHQVGDGYQRGHEHGVRAGLRHAALSASIIPDDAAVVAADRDLGPEMADFQCLVVMTGGCSWFKDGVHRCCVAPLGNEKHGTPVHAHGCMCDLRWATPTTDPAPAVADDDAQFEAEVFRLIDVHAPGLDDLDREDLASDLMQLFRPDNPGCWAEDDDEVTPAAQHPAEPTDKDFAATLDGLNEQARIVRNLPPPARLH